MHYNTTESKIPLSTKFGVKKNLLVEFVIFHCIAHSLLVNVASLLALPTNQRKDIIVFRFIIEYSSLKDFGPQE